MSRNNLTKLCIKCPLHLKYVKFSRNKRKRQPIGMLGRSSGNRDWLLANASACVSCGFRLRNARKASDCVWMETGLYKCHGTIQITRCNTRVQAVYQLCRSKSTTTNCKTTALYKVCSEIVSDHVTALLLCRKPRVNPVAAKARFPLPELTARVRPNGPSWRVTGFHYPSTRAVFYGRPVSTSRVDGVETGPSTRVVETGLKRKHISRQFS